MAELTEQQIYAALGLGERVREAADPAAQTTPAGTGEGANGQDVADPAADTAAAAAAAPTPTEPTADAGSPTGNEAGEGEDPGRQLTAAERQANAARRRQQEQARRQAEMDQAIQNATAAERARHEAEMKTFFEKAGLKNTLTGEPIANMEQFLAWHSQFEQERLRRELKAGKLTPEALSAAIDSHPVIQQARQVIDSARQQQTQQQEAEARARIDAEIAEIHELDASISSLEDLLNAPYGQQLYAMTQRGYSLKDAHFLLNHERLEQAKLEAARQQGRMSARGKDHLTAGSAGVGDGAVPVPAEEMAAFRALNPHATTSQIQSFYNQFKKH